MVINRKQLLWAKRQSNVFVNIVEQNLKSVMIWLNIWSILMQGSNTTVHCVTKYNLEQRTKKFIRKTVMTVKCSASVKKVTRGNSQCQECNRQSTTSSNINTHTNVSRKGKALWESRKRWTWHLTGRPYQCHKCGKIAAKRSKLARHFVNEHGKQGPYQCCPGDKSATVTSIMAKLLGDGHMGKTWRKGKK